MNLQKILYFVTLDIIEYIPDDYESTVYIINSLMSLVYKAYIPTYIYMPDGND